jgi:hypothetical protein
MADYAFPRTALVGGSEVGSLFVSGSEAEFAFGMGTQILPSLGAEIYGRTAGRMVLDETGEWFELGFRMDHLLSGNAAAGFTDAGNYFRIELEQSFDLATWALGHYTPAPVPVIDNLDGTWTYWSRSDVPRLWRFVTIDETATTSRYGKSITAIHFFGVHLALPNYPYAMPAAAAALQADLIALGFAGTTVTTTPGALAVEVRRHWLPAGGNYTVSNYQVDFSGGNVTAVRTDSGTLIPLAYPYAMPAAQATLQADLAAAGHSGSVVRLFGDEWQIFIPDRATTLGERRFEITIDPGDPYPRWNFFGTYEGLIPDNIVQGQFSNVRATTGMAPLSEAGKQFGRLKITPGTRYDPYHSP